MNIFDIIGPVMIGPSSSHTAGAARLGKIARLLLDEVPQKAQVKLHGSFAQTYKGHGTDKALIGGMLGFGTDDTRIRRSMEIAKEQDFHVNFETVDLGDVHPNTVQILLEGITGRRVQMQGSSIGGGSIIVTQIDGMVVEFTGEYYTLVIRHTDVPGAVAAVTSILAAESINIAFMRIYRSARGRDAVMIIETDQNIDKGLLEDIRKLPEIADVKVVKIK